MPSMNIDHIRKAAELAEQLEDHINYTFSGDRTYDWARSQSRNLRQDLLDHLKRVESEKLRLFKHQHKTP